MKGRLNGCVFIGLGICLFLSLFLSPFASSKPDGLQKVAESHGFAGKGEGPRSWPQAPFRRYSFPGIENEKVSTALSGFAGTLAIFFLALGVAKLVKGPDKKEERTGEPAIRR